MDSKMAKMIVLGLFLTMFFVVTYELQLQPLEDNSITNRITRSSQNKLSSASSEEQMSTNTPDNQPKTELLSKQKMPPNTIMGVQVLQPPFPFPSISNTMRLNQGNMNSFYPRMNSGFANPDMFDTKNLMPKLLRDNKGGNMIVKSFRRCCINGDCRMLEEGEECGGLGNLMGAQNPVKNPISSNQAFGKLIAFSGDTGLPKSLQQFLDQTFNSMGQMKYDNSKRLGEVNDFQKAGKSKNSQFDLADDTNQKGFYANTSKNSQSNSAANTANSRGSNASQSRIKKSPYVKPIGFSENEAKTIRNQHLEKSNFYRKKYGLVPFTLNEQMNNYAQEWANYLAKTGEFDHRPKEQRIYGENLYASSRSDKIGEQSVVDWYNEIADFRVGDDEVGLYTNSPTHHMTQLLWKSSTTLGVGVSKGKNGMYNIVANYDPQGNFVGKFSSNLPQIEEKDVNEAKLYESNKDTGMEWQSEFPNEDDFMQYNY